MDAHAGIQYEGEERPQPTDFTNLAFDTYNHLANGMGGLDWSGLGIVVELLGVTDVERVLDALHVIRCHRPDKPGDGEPEPETEGEPDGIGDTVD